MAISQVCIVLFDLYVCPQMTRQATRTVARWLVWIMNGHVKQYQKWSN